MHIYRIVMKVGNGEAKTLVHTIDENSAHDFISDYIEERTDSSYNKGSMIGKYLSDDGIKVTIKADPIN